MKKCLFPLDAYLVSCPTTTKNIEQYLGNIHLNARSAYLKKIDDSLCLGFFQEKVIIYRIRGDGMLIIHQSMAADTF
jgi:hypothetical protein